MVRCKGSSDTGWGRESDRVAQHESHKNVNATNQWTEPVAKRGLVNRMTHQQRNNTHGPELVARRAEECGRTILVESLILAQDQRWRRA